MFNKKLKQEIIKLTNKNTTLEKRLKDALGRISKTIKVGNYFLYQKKLYKVADIIFQMDEFGLNSIQVIAKTKDKKREGSDTIIIDFDKVVRLIKKYRGKK